jgi:hypothetical protein
MGLCGSKRAREEEHMPAPRYVLQVYRRERDTDSDSDICSWRGEETILPVPVSRRRRRQLLRGDVLRAADYGLSHESYSWG